MLSKSTMLCEIDFCSVRAFDQMVLKKRGLDELSESLLRYRQVSGYQRDMIGEYYLLSAYVILRYGSSLMQVQAAESKRQRAQIADRLIKSIRFRQLC